VFKAFDTTSGGLIISLDYAREDADSLLRPKGHAGQLLCQLCRQPVLVRAGQVNRPHFAHKTLSDCPSSREPAELVQARAFLYDWLKRTGEGTVTLEHHWEGQSLPRPVDCWLGLPDGKAFAFWIINRRIAYHDIQAIQREVEATGAELTWVFLTNRIRKVDGSQDEYKLPSTERDCGIMTDFDRIYLEPWCYARSSGSLFYVDSDKSTFTILRALMGGGCSVYQAFDLTGPANEFLLCTGTATFYHPNEVEPLERIRAEEEQRKQEEEAARLRAEQERQRRDQQRLLRQQSLNSNPPPRPLYSFGASASGVAERSAAAQDVAESPWNRKREGKCRRCGRVTDDHFVFYGADGTCICNACRQD